MKKITATLFGIVTTYFIYNEIYLKALVLGAITIILILTIKEK